MAEYKIANFLNTDPRYIFSATTVRIRQTKSRESKTMRFELVDDLRSAFANFRLPLMLAWLDLKQSYSRSRIGPFWITIGNLVGILTVAIVYGMIFKLELAEFLPFIATSMTLWSFLTVSIVESCSTFTSAESVIKQLRLPFFTYVIRLLWRNILLFCHNFVVLPIVFLVTLHSLQLEILLFLPGLLLVVLFLAPMAIILATLSARFRDLNPLVSNCLQIAFYITPVIWLPSSLPPSLAHYVLGLNPLYHLLQILRLPLLGDIPTIENYMISLSLACLAWIIAAKVFQSTRSRIALWM